MSDESVAGFLLWFAAAMVSGVALAVAFVLAAVAVIAAVVVRGLYRGGRRVMFGSAEEREMRRIRRLRNEAICEIAAIRRRTSDEMRDVERTAREIDRW